jgi:hypothetical protein
VVSTENYRWLRTLGQTSDSFNDVISSLRQASSISTKNVQGSDRPSLASQAPVAPTTTTSTITTGYAGTLEVDRSFETHGNLHEGSRRSGSSGAGGEVVANE